MADSAAELFRAARTLFQEGRIDESAERVDQVLRKNPRDLKALNFLAYLRYRQGRTQEAVDTYRQLCALDPKNPAHVGDLGLLWFKSQRYAEAKDAFLRLLELRPGDQKALRNLGVCHERLGELERAVACFERAGDPETASRLRERIPAGPPAAGAGRAGPPGGTGDAERGATAEAAGTPPADGEPNDLAGWLQSNVLPHPQQGPELVPAGPAFLLVRVREKVFFSPAHCTGHRGVLVFAPASREAEKAAGKFGGRPGPMIRAEGTGELFIGGEGGTVVALETGGVRLLVNYPALALCGPQVALEFDYAPLEKGVFLPVALSGQGRVALALRGSPVVVPVVPDLPTLVRAGRVAAWTEDVVCEWETVGEIKKIAGKAEARRLRFEGRGYLVLHGG